MREILISLTLVVFVAGCGERLVVDLDGLASEEDGTLKLGLKSEELNRTFYRYAKGITPLSIMGSEPSMTIADVAYNNYVKSLYFINEESKYYPNHLSNSQLIERINSSESGRIKFSHPPRLPNLCLSLSGGGMRSAAFSIGVLRAIFLSNIGRQVDVISTVSGGSYAAAWFYAALFKNGITAERLFQNDGGHLSNLVRNANLAPLEKIMATGITLPLGIVLNDITLKSFLRKYASNLDGKMVLLPIYEGSSFMENYEIAIRDAFIGETDISLDQLSKNNLDNKLPFFVMNVAAVEKADLGGEKKSSHVFEITPLRYGYDEGGYSLMAPLFELARSVALSSSAIDEEFHPSADMLSKVHQGLGGYLLLVPSHRLASHTRTLGLPIKQKDIAPLPSRFLYLTDGGWAENLGIYSLVNRMCANLLVVDAEHDPNFEFQAYQVAKRRLRDTMGLDLRIKGIEDIVNEGVALDDNPYAVKSPVYSGTIGNIPYPDIVYAKNDLGENSTKGVKQNTNYGYVVEGITTQKINIKYVKLSIDACNLSQYSDVTREYYTRENGYSCGDPDWKSQASKFPQEPTEDIDYSEAQFLAYMKLGELIARKYLFPELR